MCLPFNLRLRVFLSLLSGYLQIMSCHLFGQGRTWISNFRCIISNEKFWCELKNDCAATKKNSDSKECWKLIHESDVQNGTSVFCFFFNFWKTWVLFVGPLIPLFWTSWWRLPWVSKPGWIPHLRALSPACHGTFVDWPKVWCMYLSSSE